VESLTRKQVRNFDRHAMKTLGIPGVVLMENAGKNTANIITRFLGSLTARAIAIVAGGGNNGGDGFVIARHLTNRGGNVAVFLIADPQKITGDAKTNLDIITNLEYNIRHLKTADLGGLSRELEAFDLIIDAVGGTGISGNLRDDLALVVTQINQASRPVVAVDIPTGLDCDTGIVEGPVVRAELTITFAARKIGFDNPASEDYTGQVVVTDIGIPLGSDLKYLE
jgi:hydroxyethylthiazole kinase-like uncharacterized protein yjeF